MPYLHMLAHVRLMRIVLFVLLLTVLRTPLHLFCSMVMATRLKKLQANLMVVKDERIKV